MRLGGKVAIITGGAIGIGYATACKFLQEGAKVCIVDSASDSVETAQSTLSSELNVHADDLMACVANVVDRSSFDLAVSEVLARWGRVDVLVNNAGITRDARLVNMTEAQFDAVIDVNLKGVFNCTQAVVPAMLSQGSGVILNASSVVGLYGNFGQTNYAATKFGVIGFVKTWARELGPKGIRCNAVCPGFTQTSILDSMPEEVLAQLTAKVPLRRAGQPEEIANVYAFLASDEASYVNGAAIEVTGGLTI